MCMSVLFAYCEHVSLSVATRRFASFFSPFQSNTWQFIFVLSGSCAKKNTNKRSNKTAQGLGTVLTAQSAGYTSAKWKMLEIVLRANTSKWSARSANCQTTKENSEWHLNEWNAEPFIQLISTGCWWWKTHKNTRKRARASSTEDVNGGRVTTPQRQRAVRPNFLSTIANTIITAQVLFVTCSTFKTHFARRDKYYMLSIWRCSLPIRGTWNGCCVVSDVGICVRALSNRLDDLLRHLLLLIARTQNTHRHRARARAFAICMLTMPVCI